MNKQRRKKVAQRKYHNTKQQYRMFMPDTFYINRKGFVTMPAVWKGSDYADGGKLPAPSFDRDLDLPMSQRWLIMNNTLGPMARAKIVNDFYKDHRHKHPCESPVIGRLNIDG